MTDNRAFKRSEVFPYYLSFFCRKINGFLTGVYPPVFIGKELLSSGIMFP